MSMRDAERQIRAETARIVKNPKLRIKDILEWSTGELVPEDGEVAVRVESLGVNVCIPVAADKRDRGGGLA